MSERRLDGIGWLLLILGVSMLANALGHIGARGAVLTRRAP